MHVTCYSISIQYQYVTLSHVYFIHVFVHISNDIFTWTTDPKPFLAVRFMMLFVLCLKWILNFWLLFGDPVRCHKQASRSWHHYFNAHQVPIWFFKYVMLQAPTQILMGGLQLEVFPYTDTSLERYRGQLFFFSVEKSANSWHVVSSWRCRGIVFRMTGFAASPWFFDVFGFGIQNGLAMIPWYILVKLWRYRDWPSEWHHLTHETWCVGLIWFGFNSP